MWVSGVFTIDQAGQLHYTGVSFFTTESAQHYIDNNPKMGDATTLWIRQAKPKPIGKTTKFKKNDDGSITWEYTLYDKL